MSDHTVAIVSEHGAVVRMVDRLRRKLAQADESTFTLDIKIHGNAQSGKPTMSYRLQDDKYGSDSVDVKGNSVDEVLSEYLRRKGWVEKNAPLELTFESNGDDPKEDEVTF